ncbi:MAG: hypothetical protein R8G01_19635 [Ilumatobacteraceae bacterium]|nr:hypothetical protein [Ilumatobacteraceae bacterium]
MSTWRSLPRRRRVTVVLMVLCVVAVAVQMYALADRATEPSRAVDTELVRDADGTGTPVNEFIPADRDISECISAVPKPGCGSDARGGWHQSLVLIAILAGLALIVWRIVASARKAKAAQDRRVAAGH